MVESPQMVLIMKLKNKTI